MTVLMDSTEAQENFGVLITKAQREPVKIKRHGKEVAVVLSIEDFELLNSGELSFAERRFFGLNAEKWEAFMKALDAEESFIPQLEKLLKEPSFFEKDC
jgi:prevent-host-death family protein